LELIDGKTGDVNISVYLATIAILTAVVVLTMFGVTSSIKRDFIIKENTLLLILVSVRVRKRERFKQTFVSLVLNWTIGV
jgi:hypothetical protein